MRKKMGADLPKLRTILFTGICLIGYQNCGDVHLAPLPPKYPRVTFKVMYCPENGNKLRNFFARNRSAVAVGNGFEVDQDRDGLSDNFERGRNGENYGSVQAASDGNEDGYSDLAMVKAGYDATAQTYLAKCQVPNLDNDSDGLSNCDESLFHTDTMKADSDGDGVPDNWEISYGLNPLDPQDAEQDSDFDSVQNATEIRLGTPLNESNHNKYENITYVLSTTQDHEYSDECKLLEAANIPVLDAPNGNLLEMDVLETTIGGQQVMKSVNIVIPSKTANGLIFRAQIGPALLKSQQAGAK